MHLTSFFFTLFYKLSWSLTEYFSFFPDSNFLELFKIFSFQFMSTALLARVVSLSIYAEYAVLIEYYVPNGALWWLE